MITIRTCSAARQLSVTSTFISNLKLKGNISDPGWGICVLEEVQAYMLAHPVRSPYATPGWKQKPTAEGIMEIFGSDCPVMRQEVEAYLKGERKQKLKVA